VVSLATEWLPFIMMTVTRPSVARASGMATLAVVPGLDRGGAQQVAEVAGLLAVVLVDEEAAGLLGPHVGQREAGPLGQGGGAVEREGVGQVALGQGGAARRARAATRRGSLVMAVILWRSWARWG
jgi:hypothetical protein